MQRKGKANMVETRRDMISGGENPRTEVDFLRLAGITPELAEFVTEIVARPEILFSMPSEERHKIEAQMNAVLDGFGRSSALEHSASHPEGRNPLRPG
jgi:hypothetical protein